MRFHFGEDRKKKRKNDWLEIKMHVKIFMRLGKIHGRPKPFRS